MFPKSYGGRLALKDKKVVRNGFEYVCEKDCLIFLRKQKHNQKVTETVLKVAGMR